MHSDPIYQTDTRSGETHYLQRVQSVEGGTELLPVRRVDAVATGSPAVPSGEEKQLRSLLDEANGKIHTMQSMMSEAGFPMRMKWGEDFNGNEDWVRVRPESQLESVLRRLRELTNERQPQENNRDMGRDGSAATKQSTD